MDLLRDGIENIVSISRSRWMPWPTTPPATEVHNGLPLVAVEKVSTCIGINGPAHRTSNYDLMKREDEKQRLVVRRGQAFYLDLDLSRNFDVSTDRMSLVLTLMRTKSSPALGRSYIVIPVDEPKNVSRTSWRATINSFGEKRMRIEIVPSASSPVGLWDIDIDTSWKHENGEKSHKDAQPIYIIFNPWCKDDDVYLGDEAERQAYVLANEGYIWQGTIYSVAAKHWVYDQFAENILDCAIWLMNKVGQTDDCDRGNPVIISRNFTAAVNANGDDNGVVAGNWQKEITDGVAPWKWQGSRKILQQYYKERRSVGYGQCWVFAGVLATICRTLGIPCRVVTNFESAHDSNKSETIDYFVDDNGVRLKEKTRDSIWNYHVWNEAWMTRPDLGADYDGWQVIDATPQELSGGLHRCGPASVTAVKRGEVRRPYDTNFVYSEVNADKLIWRYKGEDQPLKLIRRDTMCIGKNISTLHVHSSDPIRTDITNEYKYIEGSNKERETMKSALLACDSRYSRLCLNEEFDDIDFYFESPQGLVFGQPLRIVLMIKNKSRENDYGLLANINVVAVEYNDGDSSRTLKQWSMDRSVGAGNVESINLDLSWNDYYNKLLDQNYIRVSCMAAVHGTQYQHYFDMRFQLETPKIDIKLASEPRVGEDCMVTASFKNPLPVKLTRGKFRIEGNMANIPLESAINPGEDVACSFNLSGLNQPGDYTLAMDFSTSKPDKLVTFRASGVATFKVKPANH